MSFSIGNADLFKVVKEGHIIHGCNAQGVMGSGFALQVRSRYPVAYEEYRKKYMADGLALGTVIPVIVDRNLAIHNAISQEFFGRDINKRYVDYAALKICLLESTRIANSGVIESRQVHFPLIGGGLGGGDEDILLELFESVFEHSGVDATLWIK